MKQNYDITQEDVGQAFLRGEEVSMSIVSCYTISEMSSQSIAVWTMECVGYDVDFQLNLIEKFPTFVPAPSKKGQTRKKATTTKTTPKFKADKKRKRIEVKSTDEDGDNDDFEEESEIEVKELVYKSRGTRSRPNNVL
jgi:hypothetical protein